MAPIFLCRNNKDNVEKRKYHYFLWRNGKYLSFTVTSPQLGMIAEQNQNKSCEKKIMPRKRAASDNDTYCSQTLLFFSIVVISNRKSFSTIWSVFWKENDVMRGSRSYFQNYLKREFTKFLLPPFLMCGFIVLWRLFEKPRQISTQKMGVVSGHGRVPTIFHRREFSRIKKTRFYNSLLIFVLCLCFPKETSFFHAVDKDPFERCELISVWN